MTFPAAPRDLEDVPVSSVYVPDTGFVALRGTNTSTDSLGNPSAAASFNGPSTIADGADVTQGAQASPAYTGSGNTTTIGGLKGLYAKLGQVLNFIFYRFNGGAPGNQNYDRDRSLQGLTPQTGTISGEPQGGASLTLNSATGLQPSQWVLLSGGANPEEWVLSTSAYTAGTTTIPLTTNVQQTGHTTASWNTYGVRGPGSSTFLLEGMGAQALVLNTGSPASGILAQGDASGNLKTVSANTGSTGSVVPASASFVGASDGTNLKGLLVDASGFLKVNLAAGGGSGGTSSVYGSTFPTVGTGVGASDGTNMQELHVDSATNKALRASLYVKTSAAGDTVLALGGVTSANSVPVVIASDQVAVAAKQSGTWLVRLQDGTGVTINSQGGSMNVNEAGTFITAVAASKSTDTVIKASAGRICGILVTTTGANAMQIFDNASAGSGTQIGGLPASPALGYVRCPTPVSSAGITILGSATNPGITIFWT